MTQLGPKRQAHRDRQYQAMLLEARLLGRSALSLTAYERATPNSHNTRELAALINTLRSK